MCRRYLAVIAADRQYSVSASLAAAVSLFASAVPRATPGCRWTKVAETTLPKPRQLLGC